MAIVLTQTLQQKYKSAAGSCRAVFFSAPSGFGKTCAARTLAGGKGVQYRCARDPRFALPARTERWNTLILDDFQDLTDEAQQKEVRALLRECPDRQFLLLSRGLLPGWLIPFQTAGVLTVFTWQDLALDPDAIARLLLEHGVTLTDGELTALYAETYGYALAVELLGQRLERGEPFDRATSDAVRRDLFLYYEDSVLRRLDPPTRRLLMELSPFEEITPELARLVSGDPHVNLRLAALLRDSTMMRQQTLKAYRFWPIFRQFLRWELAQQCTEEQRRSLYDRGALYYELNEEYGPALEFYTKSGDTAKVSELLAKNAEMHPGMGHYLEMEPYYRALPEARVLQSPALMQAMSMLCAMRMDMDGSERWYAALRDRNRRTDDPDIKEIRGRLAWLDIALPQRGVEGMADLFPKVFALLRAKEIRLPAFSVTSTLPSLMNGGKDFSPWSKRDTLLYNSLRLPVEAVLGKDGVGLADCAIAESKFEKGEDVRDRVMKLLAILDHIRRDGTPDIEFAAVGLLVRVQMDAGHTQEAKEMLLDLRARFVQREETRFLPNLDAMLCRIALRQGNNDTAALWYRDKAPRNPQNMQTLKRYQYLTQAMAQLAMGDPQGALFTLAPLEPYFTLCRRYIDSISMNVLRAIAGQRLSAPGWRDHMRAALDTAREFGFVRSIGQYGAAVLPVLEACAWKGDRAFLDRVLAAARMQATCYPDFLSPTRLLRAPISEAEMQVLRLICAGHSNSEICAALNIRMSTAKTHVSHILDKLQVTRRSQVKAAAQRLHLIDP